MKKVIVIVLALVLVLSMFMFTACDESKETKTKIIIKVPALGMDVHQVVDDISSVADFLENMATAYEAAHPDVDIEIAEYESAKEKTFVEDTIGTDASPDILFNSFYNMRSYAYTGKPVPVDDIFRTLEAAHLEVYEDAAAAATIGDSKYMVPFYSQQYTLAYNYSKLNQPLNKVYNAVGTSTELKTKIKNFQDNTLPKTQADAAAKIISFSEEEWKLILELYSGLCSDIASGYAYNYPFMMYAANTQGDSHILTMLKTLGADIVKDGQVSINNTQGKEALKYLAEQNAAGIYPAKAENFDINDCIDLFLNNQLLFGICNNSLYNQYKDTLPFGLVNFRGDVCENFYYGFEIFDNGDSNKLSIAKDFVKFIYTGKEDGQRENLRYSLAGLPAIKNIEDGNTNYITMYKANKDNLAKCVGGSVDTYSVLSGGITNWNDIRVIFQQEIQELLRGSKDYNEVAKTIEDRANTAIAQASGKLHP